MKKPRTPHKTTIFRRVVVLFLLVMLLDGILLLGAMQTGGVFTQIEENALEILTEVTRNKFQNLSAKMVNWSSLDSFAQSVDSHIAQTLTRLDKGYSDIAENPALNAELLESCTADVLTHLRTTDTTGAFIILDGMGVPGEADSYAGLYLRDSDALYASPSNSDLLLYRGLPPLARAMSVGLHSYWASAFHFEGGAENPSNDYFFKPLLACRAANGTTARYFGYWNGRFMVDPSDNTPVITYSRPLIAADGTAYGVIGVELTASYVDSVIGSSDIGGRSNRTCYFLGRASEGSKSYDYVLSSGVRFRQNFHEGGQLTPTREFTYNGNDYEQGKATRSGVPMTGAVCQLQLYDPNTAFIGDRWVLIGMQEDSDLYALSDTMQDIMRMVIVLGLVMGVVIALVAARLVARPFQQIKQQLAVQQPTGAMQLDPTGLAEADALSETIVALSRNIEEEAGRVSTIITLSGLPIGAFEKRNGMAGVFCSREFLELLACESMCDVSNHIAEADFERLMSERLVPVEGESDLYSVQGVKPQRFLRLNRLRDQRGLLGTLIDVTEEVHRRRRLERERDYDLLTNLLNRRAFERRAQALFDRGDAVLGPVSALLMMDLDNLKVFNDLYGHDSGDLYIRTLANALEGLSSDHCLLARRSGDEFYALFYGFASREEVLAIISRTWERILTERFSLPDGKEGRLHVSAGIAWYPEDATELQRLIHFADFAMYRVKNTAKGTVREFSLRDYREAGYLFNGSSALDQLLENRLIRFAFQPIVNALDGQVAGYELLMRPQVAELPTPDTVLAVAKTQGKLSRIERLTWRLALETIQQLRQNGQIAPGALTFINSIASEKLPPDDERELAETFRELFPYTVMEITESEKDDRNCVRHKVHTIMKYGGRVAIDDLGSGYNSEISLVNLDPAFIKLDMDIVRDVDKDEKRYSVVKSLITYAKRRGIAVIAEGVETLAELETLCMLGVDYYQGYLLARPAFDPVGLPESARRMVCETARKCGRIGEAEG